MFCVFLCFTWVAIPRWRSLCTRSSGRRPSRGRRSWPLQKFGTALIQTHARACELGVDLRGVVNLRSDRKKNSFIFVWTLVKVWYNTSKAICSWIVYGDYPQSFWEVINLRWNRNLTYLFCMGLSLMTDLVKWILNSGFKTFGICIPPKSNFIIKISLLRTPHC